MKVVVLGASNAGYEIAKKLSMNENDVSVVDNSFQAIKYIGDKLDIKPVFGHASDINVLIEADLPFADILIAITSSDEVNIVACQIADTMFQTKTKIAKINRRSYFENTNLFPSEKFPIDLIVSTDIEIANIIQRSISVPGATNVFSCANDKIVIISLICKKFSPIANMPFKYIKTIAIDFNIFILYIKRANEHITLSKLDIIKPDDEVYFCTTAKDQKNAMELFGYNYKDPIKVLIMGGSIVSQEIIGAISKKRNKINIKIIEEDTNIAESLSEKLDNIDVFNGSPLDIELLKDAQITDSIAIAMTPNDKTNIIASLLAKKLGAQRVSTILNDASYSKLLYSLGINAILDSKHAIVSKILHFIKKGEHEIIITFCEGEIEVLLADVYHNSNCIGMNTDDLTSKNEVQIAAIIKNDYIIIKPKKILINGGDKILFIAKSTNLNKISKLLQEKPQYLS